MALAQPTLKCISMIKSKNTLIKDYKLTNMADTAYSSNQAKITHNTYKHDYLDK